MPQLDSPLVTELIALQAHTRNLAWLSSRETRPDQYQHLTRIALYGILEGWYRQTGGTGQLSDLLAPPATTKEILRSSDVPSERDGRWPR